MAEEIVANNEKTTKKGYKNPTYKFEPGKSGNPNGRPKIPEDVKEAFRKATPDAIRVLCEIVNDPKAKQTDKIKAAEVILDRGYGKPTQALEVDTKSIPQVVLVGAVDLKD